MDATVQVRDERCDGLHVVKGERERERGREGEREREGEVGREREREC